MKSNRMVHSRKPHYQLLRSYPLSLYKIWSSIEDWISVGFVIFARAVFRTMRITR
jgi:hypothetical protein